MIVHPMILRSAPSDPEVHRAAKCSPEPGGRGVAFDQEASCSTHSRLQEFGFLVENNPSLIGDACQSLAPLTICDAGEFSTRLTRETGGSHVRLLSGDVHNFGAIGLIGQMLEFDFDRLADCQVIAMGLIEV